MMRCAALAAILLTGAVQQPSRVASKSDSAQSAESTNKTQKPTQTPGPPITVVVQEPAEDPAAKTRAEQREERSVRASERMVNLTIVLIFATAVTLLFIGWQAYETRKSAKATSASAALTRQQLIGTLGAVITVHHNLNFGPVGMHVGFTNEGGTTATDFQATIEVAKVSAPSLELIEPALSYPLHAGAIAPRSHATLNLDIATDWIPIGKDSRDDVWNAFIQNPATVRVTIAFSYGNGFGGHVQGERVCLVYMPAYEVRTPTRESMPHHGGFRPCEQFADSFVSARRQKEAEQSG